MNVAIIEYNAGNIYSVVNALHRLGVEPILTDNAETLQSADRIVFPGQGNALTTMQSLREKGLDKVIGTLRQPVLGICVGQQLLCRHSSEGDVDCIGVFPVDVQKFIPTELSDKVPQMGWNALTNVKGALFNGIKNGDYAYFIHSYYVPLCPYTAAETNYILPYSAALHKDNFWATQFHPEKSGSVGEQILRNFLENNFV